VKRYIVLLLAISARIAGAQGAVGTWSTQFDTQIGPQKYAFVFKQDGAALSGTAKAEMSGQSRDVVFKDVKLKADTLTFTENFEFQGNAVPITYTGVVSGNEIRFVRKVADFATENFVAKRE
jgi:hypothetical protein